MSGRSEEPGGYHPAVGSEGWGWRLRKGRGRPAPAPTEECEDCTPGPDVPQFTVRGRLGPSITWRDAPRRRPGVLETVLDGHVVLLRPEHPVPHVLNTSGGLVWQALDGRRDLRSIAEGLAVDVGLPAATIEPDVVAVATELYHAGLVATGSAADAPTGTTGDPGPSPAQAGVARLEGRTWVASIGPLGVAGTAATVRTDDAAVAEALEPVLSPLERRPAADAVDVAVVVRGAAVEPTVDIVVDGRTTWRQPGRAGIAERVISTLNELAAEHGTGHVVLHAGAAERDGRVVVVTGRSGRGKSTLTAALVQRGFRYVTDEAVAISVDDLVVRSYSKPLSLDADACSLLGVPSPAASTEGALTMPDVLGEVSTGGPVALVVVLSSTDDEPVTADGVPPGSTVHTLLGLLPTGFPVSLREPRVLDALATLVETVPVLEMRDPSLAEACERIERALGPTAGGPA